MGRTSAVDELLREAEKSGLTVERRGSKWKVVNPDSGDAHFVPIQATGRALLNCRARLRQLAGSPAEPEDLPESMPITDLLRLAAEQGVRVCQAGGLLKVTCGPDSEALARLLRDREADVLAHLTTESTPEEIPVVRVADIARVQPPKPVKPEAVSDAEALWELVSDEEFVAALAARLKRESGTERIGELETANEALRSRNADLERQLSEKEAQLAKWDTVKALFSGGA